MNPSSLFANTETNTNPARTHINRCLWFDDCAGYRVVFCRHEILYRVALDDAHHLALVAVTLRQSELATQSELAVAFGHSVATQRRWETHYRQHGSAGLQAKTPPGRPNALDRSPCAFVARWFEQGVSNREMARRLAVSETTIRRLLRQAGLRRYIPPAAELPLDDAGQTPATGVVAPATPLPVPAVAATLVPVAAAAISTEQLLPNVTVANVNSTTPVPSVEAASDAASVHAGSNTPATTFALDRDPTDCSEDGCLAQQGLLDDATPLFGDQENLPRPLPVTAAAVSSEQLTPEVTTANASQTTPVPPVEAASDAASAHAGSNIPALVFTIDRDPTDRSGDRCLARQGLLDDAAPLFGDQEDLPRAGVLLAVPVLQTHGCLEVFSRLYGSMGPAF